MSIRGANEVMVRYACDAPGCTMNLQLMKNESKTFADYGWEVLRAGVMKDSRYHFCQDHKGEEPRDEWLATVDEPARRASIILCATCGHPDASHQKFQDSPGCLYGMDTERFKLSCPCDGFKTPVDEPQPQAAVLDFES